MFVHVKISHGRSSEHRLYLGGSNGQIFQVDLHVVAAAQAGHHCSNSAKRGDSDVAYTPIVLKGHKNSVCSLSTTMNGNRLISGDESGSILVWDTRSQQQLRSYDGQGMGRITCIHTISKSKFQHTQSKKTLNDTMVPLRKFQGVATELQRAPSVVFHFRGDDHVSVTTTTQNYEELKMEAAVVSGNQSENHVPFNENDDREVEMLKRKLEETEEELKRWKSASGKLIAATTKRKRREIFYILLTKKYYYYYSLTTKKLVIIFGLL